MPLLDSTISFLVTPGGFDYRGVYSSVSIAALRTIAKTDLDAHQLKMDNENAIHVHYGIAKKMK